MTRVYRTDIGTLRPVERRPDGTILVDAHLTRCGIFQYRQPDGSIRNELRRPEDVFDPASLKTFEGRPLTNGHPPGMLDAANAKEYAVGCQQGVPSRDDDHMLGRLSVYDAATVKAMEAGRLQVSNGYTCDTVETPGIDPQYGPYDAIQKNIQGNHVALVDRGRAGLTAAARMDAECADGMQIVGQGETIVLTAASQPCNSQAMAMPTARVEVVVKHDAGKPSATAEVDPDDEANRNAEGENDAPKAKKRQPGQMADKGGDRAAAVDPDDDDDAPEGMYDAKGKLTDTGTAKIAAASFALPDKKQLPIHDPKAVKDSAKAFAKHEFDDADQKHAAFNRISGKGKQFGMDMSAFVNKHAGNLDRADGSDRTNQMTDTDIKALQEKADKADKRKAKLEEAKTKLDAANKRADAAEAEVENMKREAAKRSDAAPVNADQAKLDAKLELLDTARATGAAVTSKMSDLEIKKTVIKHVDKTDAPEGKSEGYYEALFDGAVARSKKDAADTAKGAGALAAARQMIGGAPAAAQHADAEDDTDEDAAKSRLRSANASMWRKESK